MCKATRVYYEEEWNSDAPTTLTYPLTTLTTRFLLGGEKYQIWYLDDSTGSGTTLSVFLRKEKSRGPLAAIVLGGQKKQKADKQVIMRLETLRDKYSRKL